MNNRGELTVMICLFMSILLLFLLACSEAVHISLGKSRVATATVSANESVMADYNRFLWDNYHIFAVDETYGGNEATSLNQRVTSYLELNLGDRKGIYQYSVPSVSIENRIYLAQDLDIIKNQIREYMKYQVGEDLVKETWDILSNTNQEESVDAVKKDVEAADQRAKQAEQETEQDGSSETNGANDSSKENTKGTDKTQNINGAENEQDSEETKKVEDPRKTLKKILKTGIVELVTNRTDISRESYEIREFKELVPNTVSNSKEYKNSTSASEAKSNGVSSQSENSKNSIDDISDNSNSISFEEAKDVTGRLEDSKVSTSYTEETITQVLTFQYMNDTFSSVRSNAKSSGKNVETNANSNSEIECQMEYLIAGKDNDYDNVHSVIDRIIALRFVSNYIAVVKMPDKVAEANSVAVSIAGATANPAIVELVCYLLLACESYAESVLDAKDLVAGEKVPVIKTQLNWKIGLLSFAKDFARNYSKSNLDKKMDLSQGLRYEDYLTMLLLTQIDPELKYKRMLQLMDACGRKNREDFAMEHMLFGFQSNVDVGIAPKFSGIVNASGGYRYKMKKYISY